MTALEDRLRAALAEEAERTDVDVLRSHHQLGPRLARPRSRPRGRALVAAAAVLVVGAVGVAVVAPRLGDDSYSSDSRGAVDDTFTCPATQPVDLSGTQDEFVPDLQQLGGPSGVAREYRAPRWKFSESGASAELRLANDDGTLGSLATYTRTDDGWVLESATVCGDGDPAAPTPESLRLGPHGTDPYPPRSLLDPSEDDRTPVLVDDRAVYDYSGLVTRHRAIYVVPCRAGLCFAVGQPDGVVQPKLRLPNRGSEPAVLAMCDFFVPDDLVGRASGFRLLALWDPRGAGSAADVVLDEVSRPPMPRGSRAPRLRQPATLLGDPSWRGAQLWVALVPEGVGATVRLSDGDSDVARRHLSASRCD